MKDESTSEAFIDVDATVVSVREVDTRPASEIIAEKIEHLKQMAPAQRIGFIEHHGTQADRSALEWARVCPKEFRDVSEEHAPVVPLWTAAMSWARTAPAERWLGLIHPMSGVGKTSAAYAALKVRHERGFGCFAITCERFAAACILQYDDDENRKRRAREVLESVRKRSVVLLDDLGHEKVSPKVEEQLKGVLDERSAHHRPLVWTSNFTLDELAPSVLRFRLALYHSTTPAI